MAIIGPRANVVDSIVRSSDLEVFRRERQP
jgi:hypothetical protein